MSLSIEDRIWRDIFFTSNDGLSLHARHYPAREQRGRRPLLCIPGLTRNSADFHDIAVLLSTDEDVPRDVYCIDLRGRGLSDYDTDWKNYAPFVELIDVLDFVTIMGLSQAAILGTSRGGIIAMLMAAVRPTAIGTVILNDIGPVLEKTGLARLKGYVGLMPEARNWEEAASIARSIGSSVFSDFDDDDWMRFAHQLFIEDDQGLPAPSYDTKLAEGLAAMDLTKPIPDMWPQFDALARTPVMLIRGEKSDILSEATAKEMTRRHARLEYFIARNEGHAPLLWDAASQGKIADFLARTDFALQTVSRDGSTNVYVAA